jgi:hypothetical protein
MVAYPRISRMFFIHGLTCEWDIEGKGYLALPLRFYAFLLVIGRAIPRDSQSGVLRLDTLEHTFGAGIVTM